MEQAVGGLVVFDWVAQLKNKIRAKIDPKSETKLLKQNFRYSQSRLMGLKG